LLEGVFGEPTLQHLVMDYYPEPEPTTADIEPEPEITLPSIYGAQYVPGVEPEITTDQVEPSIEPEPEVTTADIELPIEPEPEITTDQILSPEEQPEIIVTPTPTEERLVKWIPEPFFSFINEVFGR